MDNLTHTLLGLALADALPATRLGRGGTLALLLASNLPDLDVLAPGLLGAEVFEVRRTLTHSLLGAPLLAAAGTAGMRLFGAGVARGPLFGLFLLGIAVHVFFDLVNSFGVLLLFPFDGRRLELAWIFIVDPFLAAIPLASAVLARARLPRERTARIALALVAAYVAFCGLGRALGARLLERTIREEGIRAEFTYVFPEALGPHRFRGVARSGGEWRVWLLHVLSGRADPLGGVPTEEDAPEVREVRRCRASQGLGRFFLAPVWRWLPEVGEAEVFDLRFRSAVLAWRKTPFVYRVRATPDGEGIRSGG
ncbi:MAG TPA: metal-dependent hydrolase [Planctomycetota bacterium]|nr:metal-dependent hydrolase [Planctomycetota bacterium]